MMQVRILLLFLLLTCTYVKSTYSQISVIDNVSAAALAEYLTGDGVIILNPTLNGTCPGTAVGKFNYNGTPSAIGIDSGIVLTCGRVVSTNSNFGVNAAFADFATNDFGGPGDPLLTILANTGTNDACILEFDFVPAGDSVHFEYVFASEEYNGPHGNYNCTINDVFGFFISGGMQYPIPTNIALVPGTNLPVGVSTVNDGTSGCSNHTQYYNYNAGSLDLVYSGFTDVFMAYATVTPCDTYHLKLAIADASDFVYDSGVFLKAGSLMSSAITVKTKGGAGLETPFTNTVRGCPPGTIEIKRSGNLENPITIPLMFGGTAVNGLDYGFIPSSVIIPAGDSAVTLYVQGLPTFPPTGKKSVVVDILSPYNCAGGMPTIIGTDSIWIYDSLYVEIINNDTVICEGESIFLQTIGDTVLFYNWTPGLAVSNPLDRHVLVKPTHSTLYTVTVSLDSAIATGCGPSSANVFVEVKSIPIVDAGDDMVSCGSSLQLNATTQLYNPDETYEWSPPLGLSNPNIPNPDCIPLGEIAYVVKVNAGAIECDGFDTVVVTLFPDKIEILTPDTVICEGASLLMETNGHPAFTYNWYPEIAFDDAFEKDAILSPNKSGFYKLMAFHTNCDPMIDSIYVDVQPIPEVKIASDSIICTTDTLRLLASVDPANYANYSYTWQTKQFVSDPNSNLTYFYSLPTLQDQLVAIVSTPAGCEGSDTMLITAYNGRFLTKVISDTAICPPAIVRLFADGAQHYRWMPDEKLSHNNISNPLAQPVSTQDYTVIGTYSYSGHVCYDSQTVTITVHPQAVLSIPDSVEMWIGEEHHLEPQTNCYYFSWFPHSGISGVNISDPVFSPEVRTRYFVTAATEYGCELKDSIDVLVNLEAIIDLPNAFNPNGQHGNFKPLKRGNIHLNKMIIYNRWGSPVFQTTNVEEGWDGTYNGHPQPMGVYVYVIEAETSATGKPFRKEGNVTLIR